MNVNNTCIVLLDIWGLSSQQVLDLGPVCAAWERSRSKIAELVEVANEHRIPLYFNNRGWPIPSQLHLRQALLVSSLPIAPQMFVKEGYHEEPWCGNPCVGIRNDVDPSRFENLVYAGYAAEACLANRREGYRKLGTRHNSFLIKDATLVQFVLYNGKNHFLWPEYSKVMKARSSGESLPWESAQDLIDETLLFCDKYASRWATPLTVSEFKEKIQCL